MSGNKKAWPTARSLQASVRAMNSAGDKLKSNMVRAEGYEIRNIRLRKTTCTVHANLYKDNELVLSATLETIKKRLRGILIDA